MVTHSRVMSRMSVVLAVALLSALGCGKPPVELTGKVVLPSQVKLEEQDSVQIAFMPVGDSKGGGSARASVKDLTFTAIATSKDKGIVPGTYKIAVQVTPYAGMPGSQKRANDLKPLNTKFGSEKTPLTYEVVAGSPNNITIDLAKGTVTKN